MLKKKQRLTESDWSQLISECEQSQEKVSDFCSRKNVSYKSFLNKRSRLNKSKAAEEKMPLKFTQANIEPGISSTQAMSLSNACINLQVGKQLILSFSVELLPEVLSKVMTVLE